MRVFGKGGGPISPNSTPMEAAKGRPLAAIRATSSPIIEECSQSLAQRMSALGGKADIVALHLDIAHRLQIRSCCVSAGPGLRYAAARPDAGKCAPDSNLETGIASWGRPRTGDDRQQSRKLQIKMVASPRNQCLWAYSSVAS
jgi:hypothetical protein